MLNEIVTDGLTSEPRGSSAVCVRCFGESEHDVRVDANGKRLFFFRAFHDMPFLTMGFIHR